MDHIDTAIRAGSPWPTLFIWFTLLARHCYSFNTPTFSSRSQVRMMLGVRWAGDDGKMAVDSELEEEWSRLHDMRINSNGENGILEYTGKGKTIRLVGFVSSCREGGYLVSLG